MSYRAPLSELASALRAAGYDELIAACYPELDATITDAVLTGIGQLAADVLAPLNQRWDRRGARFENGRVHCPEGFTDAYRAFAEGGWNGLTAPEEYGGQGLPRALGLAVFEIVHAANLAFGLCPMLSQGAIEALFEHGSIRQKRLILPKLISGEWAGTMNLTEGQAGSDLAAIATCAEADQDGHFRLRGEKIFITWGDQDAARNICHLVLARTAGAPPGVRGLSLFLVSKYVFDDEGKLGGANNIRVGSIERKMGIHGSPTCTMLYEGAKAELVGELHQGLAYMFVMMNAARLQVGVQGVAIAERAYQSAVAYASERRQGRSPWSAEYPALIVDHPDVRRMLLSMRARIVGGRALCLMGAVQADLARIATTPEKKRTAQARHELLTPITKAWCTDMGVNVASLALQIHGGLGYIDETGVAQYHRDARIAPIYEGTNAIQAIDLIGRKLVADGGSAMRALCDDIAETAQVLVHQPNLESYGLILSEAVSALFDATEWILKAEPYHRLATATVYLELAGNVIAGWLLAQSAVNCASLVPALWSFAHEFLRVAPALLERVREGAGPLCNADGSFFDRAISPL